jgi:hypothetical protein
LPGFLLGSIINRILSIILSACCLSTASIGSTYLLHFRLGHNKFRTETAYASG